MQRLYPEMSPNVAIEFVRGVHDAGRRLCGGYRCHLPEVA
jgi:hypothetical protein